MNTIQPDQVGCSPARLKRIDAAMQRFVDEGQLAGIVAMVARRGQIPYAQCFGLADLETSRPMQLDTLFRIYSMTKPITSVATMMLFEEGHFHLTDPISRYIPEFEDTMALAEVTETGLELANLERPITIWHLLTHTSGLTYGFDPNHPLDKMFQKRVWRAREQNPEMTLAEMVYELARLPLIHQPGSAWRYGPSVDVLGYLVQVISGKPFEVFMQERIFEPLGMADTFFWVPQDKVARLSVNYGPAETGGLKVVDPAVGSRFTRPARCPSGGAGLISTAPDYMRFSQMLLNKGELDGVRLLGRKTVEVMTMNHLGAITPSYGDPARGFGLGFEVCLDVATAHELDSVGSYGWGGVANTTFWIDPQEELVGLMMTQYLIRDVHPVIPAFRRAVYQALVD